LTQRTRTFKLGGDSGILRDDHGRFKLAMSSGFHYRLVDVGRLQCVGRFSVDFQQLSHWRG